MNCRFCGSPPCDTCARCVNCECVCALHGVAEPLAKRAKILPTAPGPSILFPPNPPQLQQLQFGECSTIAPAPTAPSASAHRSLVSSNDPETSAGMGYQRTRDKLRLLGNLLELDPGELTRLQYEPPGVKFEDSPNRASLQLMKTVILGTAKLLYPSDPQGLAARFMSPDQISSPQTVQGMLAENVITAMKKTRRGTLARRYIRSVLCGTMTRSDVNELLGYPSEQGEHCQSIVTTGPNHECRGLQREGATGGDGDDDDDDEGDECGEGSKLPRMSAKTFSRARRDWAALLEAGELQPVKFGRARVRDEALEHLLTFLFEPENIVLESWCSQLIVANGKKLDLPAVVGSKTGGVLYDAYCKLMQGKSKKPLSRGSFYAVAKTLTRREVRRVLPVDNITQTLVRDPLILVRDIIHRTMPNQHRSTYFRQVDKVEWFLTHSFVNDHVGRGTSGFHDLDFALRSDVIQNDINLIMDRSVHCKGCLFPFLFLAEIRAVAQIQVDSPDSDTIEAIYQQIMFYMRLLCRKAAQDKAIENSFKEILSKKLRNRVVVFMNHLGYDDATRTGKSHLMPDDSTVSMHGSAVFFLARHSIDAESEHDLETTDLGSRYYTHFIRGSPHSDGERQVISALEALLYRISTDIPMAEEVIFVSDNSPSYKNGTLPSVIPHLSRTRGLRALRYIYSCSQLCEFLIDAQFEVVMSVARDSLMAEQSVSSEHVVHSVNQETNLPNVSVELLSLGERGGDAAPRLETEAHGSHVLACHNDIIYQDRQIADPSNPGESGNVIARIREFSGIGRGACFEIKDSTVNALKSLVWSYRGGNSGPENAGAAWVGLVTGVNVVIPGKKLDSFLQDKSPLPNGVSDGPVEDAIVRLRNWKQVVAMRERSGTTEAGGTSSRTTPSPGRTCPDCRRSFKSESFQRSHNCKGSSLEKDVSARAVAVASEMLAEGKLPIFRDASEQLSSSESKQISNVWYGWAKMAMSEESLESSNLLQYKREVFDIFSNETWSRMDAVDVRSELKMKYPSRTDIPTEKRIKDWLRLYEATKRIQPFYIAPEAGAPIVSFNDDPKGVGSGRVRMNPRYTAKITAMHQEHLTMPELKRPKPRNMYKEFENFYRDDQGRLPVDFPDQRQVMNKINALRTKSKQRFA